MTGQQARLQQALALAGAGRLDAALALCMDPGPGPGGTLLQRLQGQLLQAMGRDREAVSAYQAVVATAPGDWEIWNNLGNSLRAVGDLPGALSALRRAASIRPDILPIWANLASALAAAREVDEALQAYRRAAGLGPEVALDAARLLRSVGRFEEAIGFLERAPGHPSAMIERARNLTGLRRLADAEAAYRAGIASRPDWPDAWLELGLVLERAGRVAELTDLLDAAAAVGVPRKSLPFLVALVHERRGEVCDALAWARNIPSDVEPVRTQRLISRLAEKSGDSRGAFDAAMRANALAEAEHPAVRKRAADWRDHVEAMTTVVTPDWYSRWPAASVASGRPAPAFLVGFPRSGTTLLDTMLMGHPNIHVLEEIPLLERVRVEIGDPARVADLEPAEVDRLRALYFDALDAASPPPPGSLVVDKLPLNILGAPLIHRLFPDARFIFAVRHPCDVVLSCVMQGFEMNDAMANFLDLGDAARLYDLVLGFWQRSRDVLPLTIHESRYEHLVAAPGPALRALVDFLGLEWHEDLLDHRRTARERGTISTPSYNQVTQPIYAAASGRWRRYRDQLAPVLPLLLPWAERLGCEA